MYRALFITTVPAGSIESLQSVTNGGFNIQIDSDFAEIEGVDFSACSGYNDVASVLQMKLRAVGVGGFSNCIVTSSADSGDVKFIIISGSNGIGSYVTELSSPYNESLTDISIETYLNGQGGGYFIELNVYLMSQADQDAVTAENDTHSYSLYLSNYYNSLTDSFTGECVEQDIITEPMYADWYNALNLIEPFSSRPLILVSVNNK